MASKGSAYTFRQSSTAYLKFLAGTEMSKIEAEKGDSFAHYYLGICYQFGIGILEETESVKWYREAAEQEWRKHRWQFAAAL